MPVALKQSLPLSERVQTFFKADALEHTGNKGLSDATAGLSSNGHTGTRQPNLEIGGHDTHYSERLLKPKLVL